MRFSTYFLLLALACTPACAQDADQPWNWYFAGFNSPSSQSGVLLRSGIASVLLDVEKVSIEFVEADVPEAKARYLGQLFNGVNVKGQLDGFFLQGPEMWNGTYSQLILNEYDCHMQEIILKSGIPDGSVLVIVRAQGKCQ